MMSWIFIKYLSTNLFGSFYALNIHQGVLIVSKTFFLTGSAPWMTGRWFNKLKCFFNKFFSRWMWIVQARAVSRASHSGHDTCFGSLNKWVVAFQNLIVRTLLCLESMYFVCARGLLLRCDHRNLSVPLKQGLIIVKLVPIGRGTNLLMACIFREKRVSLKKRRAVSRKTNLKMRVAR